MTEGVEALLSDIHRWVKIIGIQEAKGIMQDALTGDDSEETQELRIIYHLTNGENSTRDIESHVSIGRNAISSRQKQWASMGIVEKEHQNAPYERLISLQEAGLEKPEIPELEAG